MKISKVLIIALMFVVLSVSVIGATCNSCSDCTTKINAASPGDTVTLTADVSNDVGECISIDTITDVTFDCQGHTIDQTDTSGDVAVFIDTSDDITVQNCNIHDSNYGFIHRASSNTIIFNNNITSVTTGIYNDQSSTDFTIESNYIDGSGVGGQIISIHSCTNGKVIDNTIADIGTNRGIFIYNSVNIDVRENTITGSNGDYGIILQNPNNYINITENTIDGTMDYGMYFYSGLTNIKVWNNNILAGTVNKIKSLGSIELSYNNVGNFWGRTSSPYFIAGTDSNAVGVVDSNPLSSAFYNDQNDFIAFGSQTPLDGANVTSATIDVDFNEPDLDTFIFNWNYTNYSYYDDSLILMTNFNNNPLVGDTSSIYSDLSLTNNDASKVGSPSFTTGVYGSAFYNTGSGSNYASFSDNSAYDISDEITIEAWIKSSSATGCDVIFENSGLKSAFYFRTGDPWIALNLRLGGGNLYQALYYGDSYADNQWHHYVGTFDRNLPTNRIKIYKDGQVIATGVGADLPLDYPGDFLRTGRWLTGAIDEVKMYSRALTQDEINFNYNSGLTKLDTISWSFETDVSSVSGAVDLYAQIKDTSNNVLTTEVYSYNTVIGPTLNEDYIVSGDEVFNSEDIDIGSGKLICGGGDTLTITNGITFKTSKLELTCSGDCIFIDSGSQLIID